MILMKETMKTTFSRALVILAGCLLLASCNPVATA